MAVVVPGPGFDAMAVLAHFEGRLARFKHPRAVVTVAALPRTALGKVQVEALRLLVLRPVAARSGTALSQVRNRLLGYREEENLPPAPPAVQDPITTAIWGMPLALICA